MQEYTYRFQLGNFECMSVLDTVDNMDFNFLFPYTSDSEITTLLSRLGIPRPTIFEITCLLIKTSKQNVLIDTGFAPIAGTQKGMMFKNLQSAGVRPADIDTVIISHGHLDHIGGNMGADLKPNFPNARYVIHSKEWEFWSNKPDLSSMNEVMQKEIMEAVNKSLLSLKNQISLVDAGKDIVPGIQYIDAPGHTPGHAALAISSGSEQLLYVADIFHNVMQLARPDWITRIDLGQEKAMETRKKMISRAISTQAKVFASHFPFPCIGYIVQKEDIFLWKPLNK
jgi:glyoxylase-like metal-dependent hydrolase (beta-lactamase superfamily II)